MIQKAFENLTNHSIWWISNSYPSAGEQCNTIIQQITNIDKEKWNKEIGPCDMDPPPACVQSEMHTHKKHVLCWKVTIWEMDEEKV